MKRSYALLVIVTVPLNIFLTNCGANLTGTLPPPAIVVSPKPTSVAVNSVTTFTATGTSAATNTNWVLQQIAPSSSLGTLNNSSANPVTYTAPATPPVYVNQINPDLQGRVYLYAGVAGVGSDGATFIVTAPTVTTGISPATASVALGATQQFYGYAVGSTNTGITFQVNGVTGGSAATGTISNTGSAVAPGLYTAPATMPMSGSAVTITVISQSDSTKTASAVVTLH